MTNPEFALARNPFGRLVLTAADGTVHTGVVPVRAFPVVAPLEGLSLISTDGHEVAWIARLADLPVPMRALLDEELATREFVPEIRRLVGVSSFSTPSTWRVETDRGTTELVLKAEEDIRRLRGRTTLLIAAASGVSYRVPDSTALDKASRKLLERFL